MDENRQHRSRRRDSMSSQRYHVPVGDWRSMGPQTDTATFPTTGSRYASSAASSPFPTPPSTHAACSVGTPTTGLEQPYVDLNSLYTGNDYSIRAARRAQARSELNRPPGTYREPAALSNPPSQMPAHQDMDSFMSQLHIASDKFSDRWSTGPPLRDYLGNPPPANSRSPSLPPRLRNGYESPLTVNPASTTYLGDAVQSPMLSHSSLRSRRHDCSSAPSPTTRPEYHSWRSGIDPSAAAAPLPAGISGYDRDSQYSGSRYRLNSQVATPNGGLTPAFPYRTPYAAPDRTLNRSPEPFNPRAPPLSALPPVRLGEDSSRATDQDDNDSRFGVDHRLRIGRRNYLGGDYSRDANMSQLGDCSGSTMLSPTDDGGSGAAEVRIKMPGGAEVRVIEKGRGSSKGKKKRRGSEVGGWWRYH